MGGTFAASVGEGRLLLLYLVRVPEEIRLPILSSDMYKYTAEEIHPVLDI